MGRRHRRHSWCGCRQTDCSDRHDRTGGHGDSVYLTWTDNSVNESGFRLWYALYETGMTPVRLGSDGPIGVDATSITVADLPYPPGTRYVFYLKAYNASGESDYTSVMVFTPAAEVTATRFQNRTSHPIISLEIDGVEEFPVSPFGILPGGDYIVELAPGTHTVYAANGFWQDNGTRFEMYTWGGTFDQVAGEEGVITFDDPTMQQLLTNFGESAYWGGMYWTGLTPHSAGYCFYSDGTYRFYSDGGLHSSGTYWETYRGDLLDTFQTSAARRRAARGDGEFSMLSSPPDDQYTEYNRNDAATCPAAP